MSCDKEYVRHSLTYVFNTRLTVCLRHMIRPADQLIPIVRPEQNRQHPLIGIMDVVDRKIFEFRVARRGHLRHVLKETIGTCLRARVQRVLDYSSPRRQRL